MIIGVDVDDTYVDMASLWWNYLESRFPLKDASKFCNAPYNYSEMFVLPDGVDGLEFWRDHNLYAGLSPIEGAVEVLNRYKDMGNEVVFVTRPKGLHHKSKYYFLEKTFPRLDGVIMTHEKKYARIDVLIDDNSDVLESVKDYCTTVKYGTTLYNTLYQPNTVIKHWRDLL